MVSGSTSLPRFDSDVYVYNRLAPLPGKADLWITGDIKVFAHHSGYIIAYHLQHVCRSSAAIPGQNNLQALIGLSAAR